MSRDALDIGWAVDADGHPGKTVALPLDLVTSTMAILAIRRAGKSNAAAVIAEQLYEHGLPFVVVDPKGDWWGLRSGRDGGPGGLHVPVFGGLHGDVPLEQASGAVVAEFVANSNASVVLDVSEMSKTAQSRFLKDFVTTLLRVNRDPRHVILEECDEYVPQRVDDPPLVAAVQRMVKRGGFRGLGVTLISQRSAAVNKDVLTQCETLVAMRVTSPQDRRAVRDWLDYHAGAREIVDSLPQLPNGQAWISSPHWWPSHGGGAMTHVMFERRHTFDSGATPEVGVSRPAAQMADVDLDAVRTAMAATIEKAQADDPKLLRKRIAELETQLAAASNAVEKAEPVEVSVLTEEDHALLMDGLVRWETALREAAAAHSSAVERLTAAVERARGLAAAASERPALVARRDLARQRLPIVMVPKGHAVASDREIEVQPIDARGRPDGPRVTLPPGNGKLPDGEAKILTAAAQHAPQGGVTREQLSVLTGYKRSSRDTYVQRLRARGYVTTDGGGVVATPAGVAALGDSFEPLPTGAALRDHWFERLPEGESRILAVVVALYPDAVPRDTLSEQTGYKRSSRDTYVQRLRARQLVTTDTDGVRAADVLFARSR